MAHVEGGMRHSLEWMTCGIGGMSHLVKETKHAAGRNATCYRRDETCSMRDAT
jgi:hypothetical protein